MIAGFLGFYCMGVGAAGFDGAFGTEDDTQRAFRQLAQDIGYTLPKDGARRAALSMRKDDTQKAFRQLAQDIGYTPPEDGARCAPLSMSDAYAQLEKDISGKEAYHGGGQRYSHFGHQRDFPYGINGSASTSFPRQDTERPSEIKSPWKNHLSPLVEEDLSFLTSLGSQEDSSDPFAQSSSLEGIFSGSGKALNGIDDSVLEDSALPVAQKEKLLPSQQFHSEADNLEDALIDDFFGSFRKEKDFLADLDFSLFPPFAQKKTASSTPTQIAASEEGWSYEEMDPDFTLDHQSRVTGQSLFQGQLEEEDSEKEESYKAGGKAKRTKNASHFYPPYNNDHGKILVRKEQNRVSSKRSRDKVQGRIAELRRLGEEDPKIKEAIELIDKKQTPTLQAIQEEIEHHKKIRGTIDPKEYISIRNALSAKMSREARKQLDSLAKEHCGEAAPEYEK